MFQDTGPDGLPWGEQPLPSCHACRNLILPHHQAQAIRVPPGVEVEDLDGIYHAECAAPLVKLVSVLELLNRSLF